MPRNRRMFRHGGVYHVTNRTKAGLPFVPNKFMSQVISGILTRALELYPGIELAGYKFMGNHFHMVLSLLGSGEELSAFVGYVQGELSSIIHRLTGVAHDNLWAGRFRVQELLTPEAVLEKLVYLYLNPVAAHLVDRVDDWEGPSSWAQFNDGRTRLFKWVTDASMPRLPRIEFSSKLIEQLCDSLHELKRKPKELRLNPFAWKTLYQSSSQWTDGEIKENIIKLVRNGEKTIRAKRLAEGKKIAGVQKLRHQSIYRNYKSSEYRKTPLALSTCRDTLKLFKKQYQIFCDLCRRVWDNWKKGDFSLHYPPGAFIPTRTPLASIWSP